MLKLKILQQAPPCSPDAAMAANDPGACARCSQKYSTCCAITPDIVEYCFPLSLLEQKAIKTHTGSATGLTKAKNTVGFTKSMQELFPGEHVRIAALFPPQDSHYHLSVGQDCACLFLKDDGCALPRAVRPAYCRLFPFWIRKGAISHFSLSDCQAQRESRSHADLRKTFALSDTDIFTLYQIIRQGWGLPPSH